MRCFVALEISDEARVELVKIQKFIAEAGMKLVEQQNLHMTLAFLGELTDAHAGRCRELLKSIKSEKFSAHLGSAGVFPSEYYIRVAWVGLEPEKELRKLHSKIHSALKGTVNLEDRFEPHITLARIKSLKDKKQFIEKLKNLNFRKIEFEVSSFSLKKSTLTSKCHVYEDIERIELH
ncbi:MAG: RNA 2',3'-cyclic phosphodiesterase [archaeon]